jgi:predicted esterase
MEQMTFRELTNQMVALYHQGKMEEALHLVEQHLDAFPEQNARLAFWRMCLLSRSGRPADVLPVFEQGLASGLWWTRELFADTDLDAVRELPEFQRLVDVSQQKFEEARMQIPRERIVLKPETPASGRYPMLIALHGRNANMETHVGPWEAARRRGWLVVAPQSTQPLFPGAYCWDDPQQGLADVRFAHEEISQQYPIDPQRILIAGFSQGSGMAMYMALRGSLAARGFIGVASWWVDPKELIPQGEVAQRVRGYFITGEKDHTVETAREIQNVLRENDIQFGQESHPDLAHEFSSDFGQSFEAAIDFIFKEQE